MAKKPEEVTIHKSNPLHPEDGWTSPDWPSPPHVEPPVGIARPSKFETVPLTLPTATIGESGVKHFAHAAKKRNDLSFDPNPVGPRDNAADDDQKEE